MYFVYILECKDGSLYTGITTDIGRRVEEHKNGTGAKYTRSRGVRKIVYSEAKRTRSSASKREALIKSLKREQKIHLIQSKKISRIV